MSKRRSVTVNINGVRMRLQRRPDGGLRVSSKEMPGLILSHSDAFAVLCDIPVAVAVLYAHRRGRSEYDI